MVVCGTTKDPYLRNMNTTSGFENLRQKYNGYRQSVRKENWISTMRVMSRYLHDFMSSRKVLRTRT